MKKNSEASPILFSTPMVDAMLHNLKTRTRRVMKPQPILEDGWYKWPLTSRTEKTSEFSIWNEQKETICPRSLHSMSLKCPFKHGQKYWVREKWAVHDLLDNVRPAKIAEIENLEIFFADMLGVHEYMKREGGRWRSALHLPYKLRRIEITVKSVLATRLLNIDEETAAKEGVYMWQEYMGDRYTGPKNDPVALFKALWASIHGEASLVKKPWVWDVEFSVEIVNGHTKLTL